MNIQEIMAKPAVTCRPTDSLETAAQRMWERDCGALPVVDDQSKVVGMLTDRDICMSAYTQGRALHAISVLTAMAKQVFSCHANDSLEASERLMRDKQIRRLPVVDGDNRPIGMLSLNDIARCATSAPKKNSLDNELVRTLSAISQPRPHHEEAPKGQPSSQALRNTPPAL